MMDLIFQVELEQLVICRRLALLVADFPESIKMFDPWIILWVSMNSSSSFLGWLVETTLIESPVNRASMLMSESYKEVSNE